MDLNALKSYLVKLGFQVNQSEFNKFNQTLKDVGANVERHTVGVVASFAKVGTAIVAAYGAVGTATITLMNKVADADMGYQLFAQRMFMSTGAAREMKIATDALGHSLEEIAWNPELYSRYMDLIKLQRQLGSGLGGDYEGQMRQLRDISFEFTKMKVEMQYMAMNVVKSLFGAMGLKDGDILKKLREWNNWIVSNIPVWSDKIAKSLVPVLKDIVALGTQFGHILMNLTSLFIQFTGELDGDESLKKGEVNITNVSRATERWVHALTNVMTIVNNILETISEHPEIAKILLGAVAGGYVGAHVGGVGAIPGVIIGGGVGAAWSLFSDAQTNSGQSGQTAARNLQKSGANELRALVNKYAAQYHIDPALANALVYQESRFNPKAMSPKGAIGLMQLMPGTAQVLGVNNPWDPEQNVEVGMRLLSYLMGKYNGDTRLALAAYNAGENAISRYGGVPPYLETQNYVHDIMARAAQYSQTSIGSINVNVTEPNASAEQIASTVSDRMHEELGKRAQRNQMQLAMGYQ